MARKKKTSWKYILQVSERDRLIYEQVAVQLRTQRDVANEHKISQARVSKIVERVFLWLSETAPYGLEEVPRPQRLHGVARTHRMKLAYYEREANEAWQESKRREITTQTFELIPSEDGKSYTRTKGKLTVKCAKPDIKYLNAAAGFAQKAVEFEGFAKNGAVSTSNDDRLREVRLFTPQEEIDEMIAIGKQLEARERQKAEVAARSATVASATATPSPRYSGESEVEVTRDGEFVPKSAPHPNTLPGVPRRGDDTGLPPIEALSNESAEVGSAREIAGPNDFDNGLLNEPESASTVASATATPSPRYSGERAGVRGSERVHTQPLMETTRGGREVDRGGEFVPASAPHPNPLPGVPRRGDEERPRPGVPGRGNEETPPKKVYPPTPPGFVRSGDYCRPALRLTIQDARSTSRKPFWQVNPPKVYMFDEKKNEWVAIE